MGSWTTPAGRLGAVALSLALIAGCDQSPTSSANHPSKSTPASSSAPPSDPTAQPAAHRYLHFTDITASTGIDMTITCGKAPADEILEVNGGGLGLIDFDNDGDLDLFVANGATLADPQRGPGCRLYENLGHFKFRDVTAAAGIDVTRWANGVAIGDYDGDGFDDIFICCYGPNILLRNHGDRTFSDVTAAAFGSQLTPRASGAPLWATSAAFGDIDNDGDLDLYVCNYLEFDHRNPPPRASYKNIQVMGGPHGLVPQHDLLFENLGDGTFRDITQAANCLGPRPSFGLNVVIADFDDDGWQDIVVANDSMPDFLFWNRSAGSSSPRFEEIGVLSGIASNADGANQASMGYALADVDGNGLPDKFTTVFSSDVNSLHLNITANAGTPNAVPLFEDRAQQYGLAMVSRTLLGWSAGFFDFDLDGEEDLFFVNGHVYPQATMQTMDSEYLQPPMLFERTGPRFTRAKPQTAGDWLQTPRRDRNAVFADFDHDGDIDIIIGELNGPIRALRNDALAAKDDAQKSEVREQKSEVRERKSDVAGQKSEDDGQPQRRWLIVELRDERASTKNRRALGSKITLLQPRQTRWLHTGGGFQSSAAPCAHFGLGIGQADEALSLEIRWPDSFIQRLDDVRPNQRLIIRRQD